jgi:hypothetical protein
MLNDMSNNPSSSKEESQDISLFALLKLKMVVVALQPFLPFYLTSFCSAGLSCPTYLMQVEKMKEKERKFEKKIVSLARIIEIQNV